MSNELTTKSSPKEIDTALAGLFHDLERIDYRRGLIESTMLHLAGAKYYYRGRQRVTDMKLSEAIEILTKEAEAIEEYKETHKVTESDGWVRTDWTEWNGVTPSYDNEKPAKYLGEHESLLCEREAKLDEIDELQALYTGWSRFFVVTSSTGHIHSSMSCHSCRPTTTYGWLPELSGQTEADAVEAHGPALCTHCFPTAPLDWQGGKLTKAQANKVAA